MVLPVQNRVDELVAFLRTLHRRCRRRPEVLEHLGHAVVGFLADADAAGCPIDDAENGVGETVDDGGVKVEDVPRTVLDEDVDETRDGVDGVEEDVEDHRPVVLEDVVLDHNCTKRKVNTEDFKVDSVCLHLWRTVQYTMEIQMAMVKKHDPRHHDT